MKKFLYHDPKLLVYGFLIIFFASNGQTFFIALFKYKIKYYYSLSDGQFGLLYAFTTLSSLLIINFAKMIDYIDLRIYSLLITLGLLAPCFCNLFYHQILFFFLWLFLLLDSLVGCNEPCGNNFNDKILW